MVGEYYRFFEGRKCFRSLIGSKQCFQHSRDKRQTFSWEIQSFGTDGHQRCLSNRPSWFQVFHNCHVWIFGLCKIIRTYNHLPVWKKIPAQVIHSAPWSLDIYTSSNIWMTVKKFYEWIETVLASFPAKNYVQLPIIVFVEGYKTNLPRKIVEIYKSLQIILIVIYSIATHIFYPWSCCFTSNISLVEQGLSSLVQEPST